MADPEIHEAWKAYRDCAVLCVACRSAGECLKPEPQPGVTACFNCDRDFICGIAAGKTTCWCMKLPAQGTKGIGACLCPRCLTGHTKNRNELVEVKPSPDLT